MPQADCPTQAIEQFRRLGIWQLADLPLEDLLVKKAQRLARRFQRPQWIWFALRKVFQEPSDVPHPQLTGMPLAVKHDEAPDPLGIPLSRLQTPEARERGPA